jgi:tricorn protease
MKPRLALSVGLIFVLICFAGLPAAAQASAGSDEARVLRTPALHGGQIVFSWAGDLYTVDAAGGTARKLTSHEGYEIFPRFSPDGKTIAFTGEYDGNREVFLIPREGGVPQRLTTTSVLSRDDVSDRMGPNNIVMGWKNDGSSVLFRSRMMEWNDFNGQLYLVPSEGGLPDRIPLPRGGFSSFSPDDSKLAYNRVFREFRTWKRYRGGMADDIWIHDFASKTTENLTDNPAQDIIPMWRGDAVYFLSDRDDNKRMNLFVINTKTRKTEKLTDFADFDIKFPSLGDTGIVFENGGSIYRFDFDTRKAVRVPVRIADDRLSVRPRLMDVSKQVRSFEISPDGNRALFSARGDIFTVPAKHGNTRNLTQTSGVHERNPKWSPDGKWIAYIGDASGEDEIYIVAQDGSADPVQITKDADTYKYALYWSPDSKKILWADKKLRLNYVDIASKKTVVVDQAEAWEFSQYVWSPDSLWIAYARPEREAMTRVYLYGLKDDKSAAVTDGWYSSYSPVFHAGGQYLFFVSDRDFNPIYSSTEWNHAYGSQGRIYLATLNKKIESPFKPKSDEVAVKAEAPPAKSAPAKPDEKKPAATPAPLDIDVDGIQGRILRLNVPVARYFNLGSVKDSLYYAAFGDRDSRPSFKLYDLKEHKETDLGAVSGYEISADGSKMLVFQNGRYAIIPLPSGPIQISDALDLSGMKAMVDLRAEWDQIYEESWRQMTHFFYAPNMHGVDWEGLKERYRPLAAAVGHRADLTYVIGELMGELSVGHAYVGGGDPGPQRIMVGRLGADLSKDAETGFFRIERIYKGRNWNPDLRSPLTEVGVDAREGDYIVAVDGRSTADMADLHEALLDAVGKQVRLKLNAKPVESGARETIVLPIPVESGLVYFNWVQENIAKVEKATDGRVGYIHVPNMGPDGLNEFVKHYYPQLTKKALIIDVRGNGGGNVSPMLIERLRREIAMVDMSRNTIPTPDPGGMLLGPKICLMDEFSASDGDLFPYRFRQMGLGKLVGKRTWGGVVGIRGTLPFIDGGQLMRPEFASYSLDGQWIIEGVGVEPDIVVDNDPAKEFAGIDQQLDRAVAEILEELKTAEKELPAIPPYPIKKK